MLLSNAGIDEFGMPMIEVEFTAECKRNLRTLAKSYRSIRSDIEPIISQLQHGETPGDRIPRVKYAVFKVRVQNSDIQKGKSGGYRIIYYLQTPTSVVLITIYWFFKPLNEDSFTPEVVPTVKSGRQVCPVFTT